MTRPWGKLLIAAAALAPLSCASSGMRPDDVSAAVAGVPDGPARPEQQAVWEGILRQYRDRRVHTSGDVMKSLQAFFRLNEGGRAPTYLLWIRDSQLPPFNREWGQEMIRQRLLDGVCAATRPADCPQRELVTYISLGEPQQFRENEREVHTYEAALNPTTCTRKPNLRFVFQTQIWLRWWLTPAGGSYEVAEAVLDRRGGPPC